VIHKNTREEAIRFAKRLLLAEGWPSDADVERASAAFCSEHGSHREAVINALIAALNTTEGTTGDAG
jgi:hypothetical protein